MNIGTISYSVSAFVFLVFLAILLTDKHKGATKQTLLITAGISCIWSFVLVYESLISVDQVQISIFDYFKSVAWLVLLGQLLSIAYQRSYKKATIKKNSQWVFYSCFYLNITWICH